jgi:hypothetical protein
MCRNSPRAASQLIPKDNGTRVIPLMELISTSGTKPQQSHQPTHVMITVSLWLVTMAQGNVTTTNTWTDSVCSLSIPNTLKQLLFRGTLMEAASKEVKLPTTLQPSQVKSTNSTIFQLRCTNLEVTWEELIHSPQEDH